MKWIVDRIENEFAVIETDNGNFDIELKFLPEGIKEGNVVCVEISEEEEKERRDKIIRKMNRLFED